MRLALALYRRLVGLLPVAFRHEFGAEIEQSFAARARRRAGLSRLRFVVGAFVDLLITAFAERSSIAKHAIATPPDARPIGHLVDGLRQDIRFAVRTLRARADFALPVIATLALGIGSNIAVFTLIDAVLLRPVPVTHPDRLVGIFTIRGDDIEAAGYGLDDGLSYSAFRRLQEQARLMTSVAGFIDVSVGIDAISGALQLTAGAV